MEIFSNKKKEEKKQYIGNFGLQLVLNYKTEKNYLYTFWKSRTTTKVLSK